MCSSIHYLIIFVSFHSGTHPLQHGTMFVLVSVSTIPISFAVYAHNIRFSKNVIQCISCSFAICHAILFRMSVVCVIVGIRASKHRILSHCIYIPNLRWFCGTADHRMFVCMCSIWYVFCADHPLLYFNSHSFFNAFSLGKQALPEYIGCSWFCSHSCI